MPKIDKKTAKKIAHSYYDDRDKLLKDKKLRKIYNKELLKLHIAGEIVKLRKEKKISQKQLAEKINTTQAVISRIENGQVFPSTNLIQRICNAFDVQVKFKFC
ncbi:helix-turn-helix transcriptional regulator [Candidatus Parcubacteria bacterium]|nr:helix-turn-helix transcriptional regulator [Candidatus Parcubacteria bacterium]